MNHVARAVKHAQPAAAARHFATFRPGTVTLVPDVRQEAQQQEPSPTDFGSKRAFALQSIAGEKLCAWRLKSGETVESLATDFGSKRAFALQTIAGEKSCAWRLKSGETVESRATDFGGDRAFALQSIAGEKNCAWKLKSGETVESRATDFGGDRAFALQSIAGEKNCAWRLKSGEADVDQDLGFLGMAFKEFDVNGDHLLSKEELRAALSSINIPEEESDRIFASIDLNADNEISIDKWVNSLSSDIKDSLHEHAKEEYWRRLLFGGLRTDCDEHWEKLLFGGLEKKSE
jgi:hypothetical protein